MLKCKGCKHCQRFLRLPRATHAPGFITNVQSNELYDIATCVIPVCNEFDPGTSWSMVYCTNKQGHYIGDLETAKYLCDKLGIAPELATPNHTVCSVGYSTKDGKWWGWSHRACFGFSIGDSMKEGDCGYNPTKNQTANTLEQARVLAVDFAESVSSAQKSVSAIITGSKFKQTKPPLYDDVGPITKYQWFKYIAEPKMYIPYKDRKITISQDQVFGLRKGKAIYFVLPEKPRQSIKLTTAQATKLIRRSKGYGGKLNGQQVTKGTKDILITKPKEQVPKEQINLPKVKKTKVKPLLGPDGAVRALEPAHTRDRLYRGRLITATIYKYDDEQQGLSEQQILEQDLLNRPYIIVFGKASVASDEVYVIKVAETNSTIRAALQGKVYLSEVKVKKLLEQADSVKKVK